MKHLEAQKKCLEFMLKAKLIEKGWTFCWHRGTGQLGRCSGRRKYISLSSWFVAMNEWDKVFEVFRHEIAHAFAFELGGTSKHNDPKFVAACSLLKVESFRVYNGDIALPQRKPPSYLGSCTCGERVHRKWKLPKCRYRCNTCRGIVSWEKVR